MALTNKLSAIGDAIREKTGTTNLLKLDEMPVAIANIESGGGKYAPRTICFRDYTGTELDNEVANLDTSNMTSLKNMFRQCTRIAALDLSGFDTSKVTDMSYLFYGCYALKKIDMRNFTLDKVSTYGNMLNGVLSNCEIIVKSDAERDWILTNISANYSNIKTVAEYQAEGGV